MRRLISSASDSATLAFLRYVCVSFAVFLHFVALPLGALAEHNQRIVAGFALLLDQQPNKLVEIDLVFGDDTAGRGDVRGVEGCKSGIAAEDAENADPLVRADGGPLALDGVGGVVIAVEKPMQYSVLRTSLSIVFGTAITLTPSSLSLAA